MLKNFFSLLISVNEIDDEVELDCWNKIIFNNQEQSLSTDKVSELLVTIEKSGDKSFDLVIDKWWPISPLEIKRR